MQKDVRRLSNLLIVHLSVLLWMAFIFIFSSMPSDFFSLKPVHFTEYFILGMLLYGSLRKVFPWFWGISLITISISYLYAFTDEYHQSIVANRTPLFADVLLDSAGALVGTILYLLLSKASKLLARKQFKQRISNESVQNH